MTFQQLELFERWLPEATIRHINEMQNLEGIK